MDGRDSEFFDGWLRELREELTEIRCAIIDLSFPQWEYLTIDKESADVERLNIEGAKGWEFVGYFGDRVLMKRPKENAPSRGSGS